MKQNRQSDTAVILLAYVHRYLYPLLIIVIPIFLSNQYSFLCMGILLLSYAAYDLVGYLCKWKHIFCSYQNAYHQEMTPNIIDWSKIKKSDAYGIPVILGVLGIAIVLYHIFYI